MVKSVKESDIKKFTILSLVIAALIYFLLGSNYDINIYDEAIPLYGAERVSTGDVPYKDFFTIYAPGQFYLLAGVCGLFGWTLLVERIFSIILALALSYIIFLISKKLASFNAAVVSFFISVLMLGFIPLYSRAMLTALFFFACSSYVLIGFLNNDKPGALFFSGLLGGFVLIFRHDAGAYLSAAVFITFFAKSFFFQNKETSFGLKIKLLTKYIFLFASGVLITSLPLYIYLLSEVGYAALKYHLIDYPLTMFSDYRALPFPNLFDIPSYGMSFKSGMAHIWKSLFFYLPAAVCILFLILAVFGIKQKIEPFRKKNLLTGIFIFLCCLFLFNQASVRSEIEHATPAILFASILIAYLIQAFNYNKLIKALGVLIFIFFAAFPIGDKARDISASLRTKGYEKLAIGRAKGLILKEDLAIMISETVKYIKRNTSENERIFVGNSRHDKLLLNDVMLYFLAKRKAGTRYHELKPGVATELPVQKTIVSELIKNDVNFLILNEGNISDELNKSSESSGVRYLDAFIKNNYSFVEKFGMFDIFKKNAKEFKIPGKM